MSFKSFSGDYSVPSSFPAVEIFEKNGPLALLESGETLIHI
ncbi:MAG: hypothetical protein WB014_11525 [Methanosarcina sp.]